MGQEDDELAEQPGSECGPTQAEGRERPGGLSPPDMAALFADVWLIPNLLPINALVVMVGRSGMGKTAVLIEMGYSLVYQRLWRGFDDRFDRTIVHCMVCEKHRMFDRRRVANQKLHELPMALVDDFKAYHSNRYSPPFDLTDAASVDKWLEEIESVERAVSEPHFVLLVVDPLRPAMRGKSLTPANWDHAEQNCRRLIAALNALRNVQGTTMVLLHHTTKKKGEFAGTQVIRDTADALLLQDAEDPRSPVVQLTSTGEHAKMSEGEGITVAFRRQSVRLGLTQKKRESRAVAAQYVSVVKTPDVVDEPTARYDHHGERAKELATLMEVGMDYTRKALCDLKGWTPSTGHYDQIQKAISEEGVIVMTEHGARRLYRHHKGPEMLFRAEEVKPGEPLQKPAARKPAEPGEVEGLREHIGHLERQLAASVQTEKERNWLNVRLAGIREWLRIHGMEMPPADFAPFAFDAPVAGDGEEPPEQSEGTQAANDATHASGATDANDGVAGVAPDAGVAADVGPKTAEPTDGETPTMDAKPAKGATGATSKRVRKQHGDEFGKTYSNPKPGGKPYIVGMTRGPRPAWAKDEANVIRNGPTTTAQGPCER